MAVLVLDNIRKVKRMIAFSPRNRPSAPETSGVGDVDPITWQRWENLCLKGRDPRVAYAVPPT